MSDDILTRLSKAIDLGRQTGAMGQHPTNIYVIANAAADEIERLRAYLRNVVSHASGGGLSDCSGMSLNDICVEISRHHNRVWEGGIEHGQKTLATTNGETSHGR